MRGVDIVPAIGKPTVLTLVCQFCRRVYGSKDGHGVSGESTGICPTCCSDCGAPNEQLVGPHRLCTACARLDATSDLNGMLG